MAGVAARVVLRAAPVIDECNYWNVNTCVLRPGPWYSEVVLGITALTSMSRACASGCSGSMIAGYELVDVLVEVNTASVGGHHIHPSQLRLCFEQHRLAYSLQSGPSIAIGRTHLSTRNTTEDMYTPILLPCGSPWMCCAHVALHGAATVSSAVPARLPIRLAPNIAHIIPVPCTS